MNGSHRRDIVLRRLDSIEDLPAFPEAVRKIESLALDPRTGARDLADVIETDAALAARLLKVANSAFYRSAGPGTASVQQAVARLGFAEVRRVSLAIAAMRLFPRRGANVAPRAFWMHGLAAAGAARTIAELVPGRAADPEAAYTAGLLHDIGTLVLDQHFGQLHSIVTRDAGRLRKPIHLVEQETLGIDHGDIGAALAERWGLPAELRDALAGHHEPARIAGANRVIAEVVHLAEYVCNRQGFPGHGEEHPAPGSLRAGRELGLDTDALPASLGKIAIEAERARGFVNLMAA
jgi:putative nucleotidyltransferase with HDIG domain